jgi:hypothetical protein
MFDRSDFSLRIRQQPTNKMTSTHIGFAPCLPGSNNRHTAGRAEIDTYDRGFDGGAVADERDHREEMLRRRGALTDTGYHRDGFVVADDEVIERATEPDAFMVSLGTAAEPELEFLDIRLNRAVPHPIMAASYDHPSGEHAAECLCHKCYPAHPDRPDDDREFDTEGYDSKGFDRDGFNRDDVFVDDIGDDVAAGDDDDDDYDPNDEDSDDDDDDDEDCD